MKTFYEITIIRSRRATEREGFEYPHVDRTDSTHESLEMAKFNYNNVLIGTETGKELRKITESNGVVISDELITSTYLTL